jgi:hypothetical protein
MAISTNFSAAIMATSLMSTVASADVILYQHCDYGGYEVRLTETGTFDLNSLTQLGMLNDDISSVRVEGPGRYEIILYEHNRLEGRPYHVTGEPTDRCFTQANFNDVLSSVSIRFISKD